MALISFSPNTKAKSAEMNSNLNGLADGSNDALNNSLNYFRSKGCASFIIGSGLTIPTSASLASTTSTGEAVVNGKYVAPNATLHTYTASKDTYVDLKDDGTFAYVEVANGAASGMTLSTNTDGSPALRLAKVVTSGTAITSVTNTGFDALGNIFYNLNPMGSNLVLFPSLQNSWSNYDTVTYGPAYYTKLKSGMVVVNGLIKLGTTTGGTLLFTLPAGMRPPRQILLPVATNSAFGMVEVATNGQVTITAGSNVYFSLNGLSFMAAG